MSIDNVADLTPRVQYTASAAQTVFPYPFPIFADADLVVDVDGTTKALSTHYTVSGEGEDTGGNVTFLSAMAGGEIVTIYRDIAIQRLTDMQQNGPWTSASVNDEFDRLTLVDQQLESRIGRAIRFQMTDAIGDSDVDLVAEDVANKVLMFDSDGKPYGGDASSLATVAAFGTANADVFTATAGQTVFTLSANPGAVANVDLSIDGATLIPTQDYAVTGTTLTLVNGGALLGQKVVARYMQGLPTGISNAAPYYAQTLAEITAGVVPSEANKVYAPGEAERYGYIADDATDNSTALANALLQMAQTGGAPVKLPSGTARYSTSLNVPSHGVIVGAGKERTILKYTGAAQAFKQATPSSRIYELHLADFSLYDIGTGTVGLDLESVSTSNFERMWIDGFTTGVRIHSPTSGYAVYNRFTDVTTNSGATTKGFVLSGTSSNAHTFIACRANFSSTTATYGWEITDGNGNQIIACHPEGGLTAVHITATGAGLAGGNVVAFNRFESFTNGVNIASANVEHTRVVENHYTIVANPVLDSGTRSVIDDPVSAIMTRTFPSTVAASANGSVRFVRDAEGGASLPLMVLRDSASGGGTPVTMQVETERSAGSFYRGKRGGNVLFDIVADGTFLIQTLTVATLPAATGKSYFRAMVNDANATTFHSIVAGGGANVVPVFSDGTNWRIG